MLQDLRKNYEGDLSLRTLALEVYHSLRENPTAIRLWRLMRRTVIVLMIANAVALVLSSLPIFLPPDSLAAKVIAPITAGIGTLIGLGALVIMILAPFMYPRWCFKNAWSGDEAMRLTDQTMRERIVGMLTPIIAGYIGISLPGIILAPISLLAANHSMSQQFGGGMIEGILSGAAAAISTWTGTASGIVTYSVICSVLVLRGLIVESRPDAKSMFQRGYLWSPTNRLLGTLILLSMLRSVPLLYWMGLIMTRTMATIMASAATTPPGTPPGPISPTAGAMGELFWLGAYAFMIAVDFLSIYIMHRSAKWYWRRDIPIAREFLFKDADDFVPPLMRADLRVPPPPPQMIRQ
jgi:hypothetical protein